MADASKDASGDGSYFKLDSAATLASETNSHFAFISKVAISDGITVRMVNEQAYQAWFDNAQYAQNYPLPLIIRYRSGESTVTQVMQIVFEQEFQCSQNTVAINESIDFEVSNDPGRGRQSIEIGIEDLFSVSLPKCKPNAQVELTGFLGGVEDLSLVSIFEQTSV